MTAFCKSVLLCLVGVCLTLASSAQTPISGVINAYAKVTALAGSTLTVSSTAGFAAGDRVVLVQMKGAVIDPTLSIAYGTVLDYGPAGLYEYATIENVIVGGLELSGPLCQVFDPAFSLQVVSVPEYTDAVVEPPGLFPAAWNGNTGGVLAFTVAGTLTLNADIDASRTGFRGGAICTNGFDCGDLSWATGSSFGFCQSGDKGEGIAEFIVGQTQGRAKLANGGGGSTQSNCGGGGGSNAGGGGLGAFPWTGCGALAVQGIGGQALAYTADLAFAGGGGGGGYRDNSQPAAPGGIGGGIVLLEAGVLDGQGNAIRSDGENITLVSNDEGAGGGGGGGSLLLRVDDIVSAVVLSAQGGFGGDTENFLFPFNCHGPGGGGGGGYIATSLPVWPAIGLVTTLLDGGEAGQVLHPTADCGFLSTHGAAAGQAGIEAFNLALSPTLPETNLGPDQQICPGDSLTLFAGDGFDSYLWSDGSNAATLLVTSPGVYSVEISNGCGSDRDTVVVGAAALPPLDLGEDQSLCVESSLTLDAGPDFVSYAWSDGSTGPTLTVGAPGTYTVLVSTVDGCALADSLTITELFPLPEPDLGPDQRFCPGDVITLDVGPGFAEVSWSTGQLAQSVQVELAGPYRVTVADANGCLGSDSITLDYLSVDSCQTLVVFPNAFTPNGDGLNDLFRPVVHGALPLQFEWQLVNRWGQTVFLSSDYRTGWDGTFRGKPAEMGVYIWQAVMELVRDGQPQLETRSGTVTLIR
ncbi:MAG: T9SS type B sorting domain-containing protein [Bacteroidetes bacterium]|nr:T9SS type B sorting domain-containing protein [Bacteroidota bacterium]